MGKRIRDSYLVIRISSQKTYIGYFKYNSGSGVFDIEYFFNIPFNFSFNGLNLKEYTGLITSELNKRNITEKNVIFEIFSHDIVIENTISIKQKTYLENKKVIESLVKQDNSLIEKHEISLAYTIINEFKEKVEEVESDSLKQSKKLKLQKNTPKEITKINTLSYSVPIEVLNVVGEIADLLKKDIVTIDFAPNGVVQYYKRYIATPNDSLILLHISTDCSIISIVQNGVVVNQLVDNFGYMGMQSALSMYKTSLRSKLADVDDTVQTINNTFLYTITKEDLDKIPQLNNVEKDQILEAKSVLVDYTIEFLDRLNVVINKEKRNGNKFYGIYIYHDKANFPDLASTISDNLELPVQNLQLSASILKGAERLPSIDYILTTFCGVIEPLQLDYRLLQKKRNSQLGKKALYVIILTTLIASLGIIGFFLFSYIRESNKNTELNQKLLEAQAAQEVYNKYMSVSTAYNSLEEFKESNTSDLSDLDIQLKKIASIMPKYGVTILSLNATAGEGASSGNITMSVEAESKDHMAKFLTGLVELGIFESVEQTGVSDSFGEGERKVSGTILCSYEAHEEPAPETPAPEEDTDTLEGEDALPEGL